MGAVMGVITGSTLANNVQTLFYDQWWSYGYFWVVYTVNIYLYIANTMSIWGPVSSGTYQVFNSYVSLPDFFNTDIYIYYWSQFANTHGQNSWVGEAAPRFPHLESATAKCRNCGKEIFNTLSSMSCDFPGGWASRKGNYVSPYSNSVYGDMTTHEPQPENEKELKK